MWCCLCYVMWCCLCYVMLCYVMWCDLMLCYFMLCYVILCHVMWCDVMLSYVMSCYVLICNDLSNHLIFCHNISYQVCMYECTHARMYLPSGSYRPSRGGQDSSFSTSPSSSSLFSTFSSSSLKKCYSILYHLIWCYIIQKNAMKYIMI